MSNGDGPGYGAVVVVALVTSVLASAGTVYVLDRARTGWGAEQAGGEESDTVEVPRVIGMGSTTAGELLENRGLRLVVEGQRPDPDAEQGSVVEQAPLPDSRVESGSEVSVTLSTGPARIQVPNLVGRPEAEARSALETAGLTVGEVTEGGEGEGGAVTSTTPAAGTTLNGGDAVALVVAASGVEVPDVMHKSSREARRLIAAAGLRVGRTRERYDEDRRAYVVLSQEPAAGTRVPANSEVNLVVNEGD